MDQNLIPLINEFFRVVGVEILLSHLSNQTTVKQREFVETCTQVLLDEWTVRPWTTTSENGDRLLELFRPEINP
jgi:hypothetical protein